MDVVLVAAIGQAQLNWFVRSHCPVRTNQSIECAFDVRQLALIRAKARHVNEAGTKNALVVCPMVELFVASRDLALEPSKGGGIGQTLCPDLALGDGKIFRKEKENDRKAESARELGPVHFGEVTSFACENDG